MSLTYAELFAGGGGLSLGLEIAGWTPVAHAEIEPHARAILRRHWPDCRLDGDVAEIRGADYRGATLLSGGSPCQDLSIAGKRAGMTEGSGTRSSLFFEQVRIRDEAEIPYFLWENVLGALSSNTGRDFAAVLSALVGAPLAVPDDGWRSAGVASGPAGVAAWRVLDCQFFGPPQRRRRVFVLGARAGGVDPAEVLALAESVRGHIAACGEARQSIATDVGGGASLAFNWQSGGDCRLGESEALVSAIQANQTPAVIVLRNREGKPGGGKGPLLSQDRSLTLASANDQVVFAKMDYSSFGGAASVASTLAARDHAALGCDLVLGEAAKVDATLAASDGEKWGANQWVDEGKAHVGASGIPRRFMPTECERLMGWPDGHTAHGVNEEGKRYAISDSARYRIIGNGVASPVAGWIAWRLRWALEKA